LFILLQQLLILLIFLYDEFLLEGIWLNVIVVWRVNRRLVWNSACLRTRGSMGRGNSETEASS